MPTVSGEESRTVTGLNAISSVRYGPRQAGIRLRRVRRPRSSRAPDLRRRHADGADGMGESGAAAPALSGPMERSTDSVAWTYWSPAAPAGSDGGSRTPFRRPATP